MPSAPAKLVSVYGLLGDVEATYGDGGTLVAGTHGIRIADEAVAALAYLYEGERNTGSQAGGTLPRVAPAGRSATLSVPIEVRGSSTTYTASDAPLDLDVLLRIAGHDATFATEWTYTPISTGVESGVFEAYARGEKFVITAANATFGISVPAIGFATANFEVQGICAAAVADAALPAITYDAIVPPVANNITLDIHGWTAAVVRSIEFTTNREIGARADINSSGHAGYALGSRSAQTVVTIEAPALTALDAYALRDAATVLTAFSWQVGDTANNRLLLDGGSYSQIVGVEEGSDGPVATWAITVAHNMSGPNADDEYSLVFD